MDKEKVAKVKIAALEKREREQRMIKKIKRDKSHSPRLQRFSFVNFDIPEEPMDDMNQTMRSSMYKSASQKNAKLRKNDSLKKITRG